MPQQQGQQANQNGTASERDIIQRLLSLGYTHKRRQDLAPTVPYFVTQYQGYPGLYETPVNLDFFVYHPDKHPEGFVIESKNQNTSGSVDEKLPYTVGTLKQLPVPSLLIITGNGWKKAAIPWCRRQATATFHVMNWDEFTAACNRGLI